MQGGMSGDTGAEGEAAAKHLKKIISVHIGEDENTALGRWVSLDILYREIISFESD